MDFLAYRMSQLSTIPGADPDAMASMLSVLDEDDLAPKPEFEGSFARASILSQLAPQPALDRGGLPTSRDRLEDWIVKSSENSDAFKIRSDKLLCANVEVNTGKTCRKEGSMACSNCKLVSYCSKDCQRKHWPIHKRDCKDPLMAKDWKPSWERERRPPAFMSADDSADEMNPGHIGPFALGLHLWGNMPAIDLLNLDNNEKNHAANLSLACVASGDLRNVVRTINDLPDDYTGTLTIVLNDRDPVVVMRNMILLCLLGTIDNLAVAADLALHFWYSVFVPVEYRVRTSVTIKPLMDQLADHLAERRIAFGSRSSMAFNVSQDVAGLMLAMLTSEYTMTDASDEYRRVRFAPSRRDYHDRAHSKLEPAHRVAMQEFRLFGLVLPFGALNAHFNIPNWSLFSPQGTFLLNDHVTPLESWDLGAIIEAGRKHGAQRADLFGCLYFFLSDELRTVAHRLRKFSVNFHVYNEDACDLARRMNSNALAHCGLPASTRFDRIEVSNIMDAEYVGIGRVLDDWTPLLRKDKSATIIAYFMNWRARQRGADPFTAGPHVMRSLMSRLHAEKKLPVPKQQDMLPGGMQSDIFLTCMQYLEPIYDNSAAFRKFLRAQDIEGILKRVGLRMRGKHTIVPHRNFAPLDGPPSALPTFENDEIWYLNVHLGGLAWSERYVEFAH